MPETPTPTVPEAFATLAKALAADGLSAGGDFKRAGTFREAVLKLGARWDAGEPPHTARSPAKPKQPGALAAAEPEAVVTAEA